MESEEVGTERYQVATPYQFTLQAPCPFAMDNTEEGEHNVPRTFESFPRPAVSLRPSTYVPPFAPNISLVPLQLMAQDLSDDSILDSDDDSDFDRPLDFLHFSGRSSAELWDSSSFCDEGRQFALNLLRSYSEDQTKVPLAVFERHLSGTDVLALVAVSVLEDAYQKCGFPALSKLQEVYLEGIRCYQECSEETWQHLQWLRSQTSQLLPAEPTSLACKRRFEHRLHVLHMKTAGLSSSVFECSAS